MSSFASKLSRHLRLDHIFQTKKPAQKYISRPQSLNQFFLRSCTFAQHTKVVYAQLLYRHSFYRTPKLPIAHTTLSLPLCLSISLLQNFPRPSLPCNSFHFSLVTEPAKFVFTKLTSPIATTVQKYATCHFTAKFSTFASIRSR